MARLVPSRRGTTSALFTWTAEQPHQFGALRLAHGEYSKSSG